MLRHPKGFDLALTRIRRLLAALGDPHLKLPPVIHVAGTNGKGSTVAFLRAILEAAGRSVHVHTSPHLVEWNERYRLGGSNGPGRFVDDAVLAEAIARTARANSDEPITVFEILTAAGFLLFSEHPADVALIEVGLGGRLDATNVIERPAVSVIASVSLDHQAYLGDTVEEIAAEKAGIIKSGCPVVIGQQNASAALDVLKAAALAAGGPTAVYGEDFFAFEERGRMVYQDETGLLDLPLPRLPGRHQIANAANAIAALRLARLGLDASAIEEGVAATTWPGRLQRITAGRLADLVPAGAELWLDGGHNPGAGLVIAETLAGLEDKVPRPLVLVAGMINTKDTVGFFSAFKGMARQVFTVPVHMSEAGVPPEALAEAVAQAGLAAEPCEDVASALRKVADGQWGERAPRILVCGSLYLAGEVLAESGLAPD
ncbi:bifunctional folylpolyglutamate synthase/dihydrofolate synthase [Consotaella salsifontis]|nr:folylpolyglutamate synthase/dihydrofolate synthase family protein [Consotaella salsifontis]